jgi:hypothetical protein
MYKKYLFKKLKGGGDLDTFILPGIVLTVVAIGVTLAFTIPHSSSSGAKLQ